MFGEVPVLPVVVPLAAVLLVALLWTLRRRGLLTVPRSAVAVVLCVYAAGIVANTVFPIYLDAPASDRRWRDYLVLSPLEHYEVADAVMNVLVFVPVGLLVPLILGRASWWRVIVVSGALSLTIEATQLVTATSLGGGHVADIHDLLSNVAGGLLGYGIFGLLLRSSAAAALIEPYRWRRSSASVRSQEAPRLTS